MSNYTKLCCFMYEEFDEIIRKMKLEVLRTENLELKRYWLTMRRMQIDMEEAELNLPNREQLYFRLFNLVTEMIEQIKQEQDLFLVKKYMIDLERMQMDAEELYLEQEE